jgi:ATP-dependent HslUV protease subunit HslV
MAAARALAKHTAIDARALAEIAMGIAAEICIYTNANLTIEELGPPASRQPGAPD